MSGPMHVSDAFEEAINSIRYPNGAPIAKAPTEAFAYLSYAAERYRPFATLYEKITPEEIAGRIETARAEIVAAWEVAESPIERLILPYLVFQDCGPHFRCPARIIMGREIDPVAPDGALWIIPQLEVPRHRLDFAVCGFWKGEKKLVAFECDGAEFHDAVSDFARDLFLKDELGIQTIRATGAEIHASPAAAAERMGRAFADWAGAL